MHYEFREMTTGELYVLAFCNGSCKPLHDDEGDVYTFADEPAARAWLDGQVLDWAATAS